jgi:hypothetical protein
MFPGYEVARKKERIGEWSCLSVHHVFYFRRAWKKFDQISYGYHATGVHPEFTLYTIINSNMANSRICDVGLKMVEIY